ncbi:hypothetical protein GTP45_01295 [Pseudoduganella sp. FT55W]|uniref:Uncharacterized protein n=1 Tax=Duganella rivi TaxID=2666083 RepID=A0A7X4KAN5_9BURK|nr:hypothetical protein [Duganella rivi]MYM65468.1 hypothetical protein [Duganella rivi]
MKYELAQFDHVRLERTIGRWTEKAAQLDMPFHEFEKDLNWVAAHIDYTVVGDSYAYGIFAEGSDQAVAVAEIVYSRRAGPDVGWLKMLEISMGPEHSPSQISSADMLVSLVDIYVAGVQGVIGLTDVHKARVIKIYGRNDQEMTFLVSLQAHLAKLDNHGTTGGFTTKFEGRWLVIAVN